MSIVLGLSSIGFRILLGRHYKAIDRLNERLASIEQDVAEIKGRFRERDRGAGHRTRPGHSR